MALKAKWIWKKQHNYNLYNQAIIARKQFRLADVAEATMQITADSFYRLFINGVWVNDGPCRSWPEFFQYDVLDVTSYLRKGDNEIKILARYFGSGDFHTVPQQAGLLVQLDVKQASGKSLTIISDADWEIAEAKEFSPNVPKISIQQCPGELYDARLEGKGKFDKANVLFDTNEGPWKKLNERDVALLTREPMMFKSFAQANVVEKEGMVFCFSPVRLTHPGLIEANGRISAACGIATVITLGKAGNVTLRSDYMTFAVDGKTKSNAKFRLSKGKHLLVAFANAVSGHLKERNFEIICSEKVTFENPLQADAENSWCFIESPAGHFAHDDMIFTFFGFNQAVDQADNDAYWNFATKVMKDAKDKKAFVEKFGEHCKVLKSEDMFLTNSHFTFENRRVITDASALVDQPAALMADNANFTTVLPDKRGDIELMYDLGTQSIGYFSFDLVAPQGVTVDIHGVEYINPEGKIQHTILCRNGMRYITKEGVNCYTSIKRRGGRYIFVTLRGMTGAVKIRHMQVIESTYPVNFKASFSCSDARLDEIWDISARTMKLCMEDTYTDCPVYEQTLWVGDARNESVFGYYTFGAEDLGRRCARIAGESLKRYPIVGCQVPSSWDVLLPVWSFLWGISVWDYYWYTGDKDFLNAQWKNIIRNLKGAEGMLNKENLFSAEMWNMFDWSTIDDRHRVVLHCSMFFVGAIDAALKCEKALAQKQHAKWLIDLRKRIVTGLNKYWDNTKNSYVDSVHDDGKPSDSICQHTNFLSILYDIVEKKNFEQAAQNVLKPRKNMIQVGSPFAIMYLYETLEKLNREDEIVKSIYKAYLPMLEDNATTVWEVFVRDSIEEFIPEGFPTRSHCHAWSSAPVYFLNRIILGVKQTDVACRSFEVSPQLSALDWAKGAVATSQGEVRVEWKKTGKKLQVTMSAPKGVKLNFKKNDTLKNLDIEVNGKKI